MEQATLPKPIDYTEQMNGLREEMRNRRRAEEYCSAQGVYVDGNKQRHIICDMPYIERACGHKCGKIKGKLSELIVCNYHPTPFD